MAVELVGGALLSASLQFLFERVGSPEVLSYLRGKSKRCDFDDLLARLKTVFNSVTAVLDDAEQKQMRNTPGVEAWLDELQEAVFDAEDLLDEIETDALQLKAEAESRSSSTKVRNLIKQKKRFRNLLLKSSNVENDVKKILERLEFIAKQKDVLGLKEGSVREKPLWRLPTTSLVEESEVYGRDDDKDEIIKLLLSDDVGCEKMSVIPIVGMGGVGKSTLAQAVFNNDGVKEHFDVHAWVCVTEEFDILRVTKTVLKAVQEGFVCDTTNDLNSLQQDLKEKLIGKKFLIILDDVWNENYVTWDLMRTPFKYGAQGSKIIVTSRSEKVAAVMGTHPMYHLKELTDEACCKLFAKHASGTGDFVVYPELQRIGKEIVEKCKGLPLAAKTLGGLLRSTLDIGEWERVLKSDIWDLTVEESNILPALRLSYYYLPARLKRCFAYCSIFPKGYKFQKKELVLLWMAGNLLERPNRNRRMEEVGEDCFHDLVSRSFFQRSSSTEKGSCFLMHDLMVDLAKFVTRKYCFRLESGSSDEIMLKQARHLAYVNEHHDHYKRFGPVFEATHLRTFLPIGSQFLCEYSVSKRVAPEMLSKLRFLRVFSLCGYHNITELPNSVGELKHLRYLDLSYTSLYRLPESLSMLYNLQTLKLHKCRNITKLPKDFDRLVNLRYLDVEGSNLQEMPKQMSKLKSLQLLSTFIVGKEQGTEIGQLGELSNLRGKLSIKNLQNVVKATDAAEAKLRDKKLIEELGFEWDAKTDDSKHEGDILDNLLPSKSLKKISIVNYGGTKFPNWLTDQSFVNMVYLRLEGCKHCNILPPLGQLSSLKTLQIGGFHSVMMVGPEFYGEVSSVVLKPFASLEFLRFYEMSNWQEWTMPPAENAGAFSELRELSFHDCRKLTGNLPCFLPSLTKLSISRCPQLGSSLPRMPDVSKLNLGSCHNLIRVTGCHVVEAFRCLQHLKISDYSYPLTLRSLPATLKTLRISYCRNLELPMHLSHKSLEKLYIYNSCRSIKSFPLNSFPNVRELHIEKCTNLESFTMLDGIQEGLTSLSFLYVSGCPYLASFPKGGLPCPNLTKLHIEHCNELIASRKQLNLKALFNLQCFTIVGCNHADMESFPEEGLLPTTLTSIKIAELPCLKELDKNGLQQLTSLRSLTLDGCHNLQKIPEKELPTSLQLLEINKCSLVEKFLRQTGEIWKMIARISFIRINQEMLSRG